MIPRRRDEAYKVKKHISLIPESRDKIAAWAEEQGMSFSAAIEGLALVGMENEMANGLLVLINDSVNRTFLRNMNRFAKLIVFAGLEAGAAKEAAQHSYLLQLLMRQESLPDPHKLAEALQIETDSPAGKELLRLYLQREKRFRWRAVKAMKKPIVELQDLVDAYAAGEEGAAT